MSYLLDTNVISELIKPAPSPYVARFISETDEDRLHISVVTLAELRFGVALMDEGQRRQKLERWLSDDLPERFAGRIVEINPRIATIWGDLMALSQRKGTNLQAMDGLLAATAGTHDMTLVTRNSRDFARLDLKLLDPWTAG